jgi:hypothetical protein
MDEEIGVTGVFSTSYSALSLVKNEHVPCAFWQLRKLYGFAWWPMGFAEVFRHPTERKY